MTGKPVPRGDLPVETEWQFDAIDVRPVERWLAAVPDSSGPAVERGRATTIVDTYMDTGDWRLHRAGYSLRIRRKRGAAEATLKALAEGQEGLRRRREFNEALAGRDARAVLESSGPVGTRAKLAAGNVPLVPLFDVRTRRQEYGLTIDGDAAGEIAIDRTTIPLEGSESARLRRVEVEVPARLVPTLAPFVESLRAACGLRPAELSKYQAGLLAAGLQPAVSPDLGPTVIDATCTIGEVAFSVLRRQMDALLANEPGTRIGDDIEDLHDMRVAARRLRAALSVFRDVLPVRFARFRDELGWVAKALGEVRDLDVQLEQLDAWISQSTEGDGVALAPLRELLESQRQDARERMLGVLDSRRYGRLVTGFTTALQRGPLRTSPGSRRPALGAAPDLLLKRHKKVRRLSRRIGQASSPAEYHRLRIRSKRLRYALEFLSEVYPKETPPMVKRLVAMQDILGLHQDAHVAVERLRSAVAADGASLAPETIFAMGVVARRYGEQEEHLRTRVPKAKSRLTGKRWKALAREMERRRPPAPVAPVLRPVRPLGAPVSDSATERRAIPAETG